VANRVVKKLENAGIRSAVIHGNKSQTARTNALSGFKRGQFKVLVATDVAARGLDVDDITHIINYNLPLEAETYVHRIGRTGRAGSDGFAISFCSTEEKAYLKVIEKLLGERVPVDIDHQYHCDEAQNSQKPAPKNFGRGQSRGGNNRSGGHSKGGNHSRRSGGNQQNRRSKSGYRR
jgi:ATP-dependent RNA helicase RhlE